MSGQHARLSASAAHRWLHCPGSLGSSPPTFETAQGTYAHAIAADCLARGIVHAAPYLGFKEVVDGFEITCDQEMVDGVNVYLDAVRDDAQDGDRHWTEMPLLNALQQVDPDMGGTADHVRYRPGVLPKLRVFDFKYGSGRYVEVFDNAQLKIYGLGAMLETNVVVHEVTVTIVQPRFEGAAPVRDFTFKAVDIIDFVADIREAAELTRTPGAPLVAGEHCKAFCPNARTCPELERMQHALVAMDFAVPAVPVDLDRLSSALAAVPLVKERIKAIEEYAYAAAVRGDVIPGFKLVDKVARRQWKNEAEVLDWAGRNEVNPYAEPELLSPAQLEKRVPKILRRSIEQYTHKVSSGTALVPVTDNRPAAVKIAAADFPALPPQ